MKRKKIGVIGIHKQESNSKEFKSISCTQMENQEHWRKMLEQVGSNSFIVFTNI